MSKITIKRAKKIRRLEISGGDYLKNSPEKLPSRRRSKKPNVINLSDLEDIELARIVGGDRIEFREKDFKTALGTLESVIAGSSIDKDRLKEFQTLMRQLKKYKPGVEPDVIRSVWEKVIQIARMAELASGVIEKLLHKAWLVVSGYLGIG